MQLSRTVLGIHLANPLVMSSGKWAWTPELCAQAVSGGAGAITVKSFSTLERKGNPDPVVVEREGYLLNAVGLPSEGVASVKAFEPFLRDRTVPVFLSIFGDTVDRFAESVAAFVVFGADALELNISCPNVQDDHGRPFAYLPESASAVIKAARKEAPGARLFAKLSPNIPDIASVAVACAEAGVDGFTLVNTLGPGLAIDLETRLPILSNKVGGLSGPALKPIALRCVHDVYKATEGKLPIIGTGGVETGEDAIEMMMAGATLVGIGSGVLRHGYGIFEKVAGEMQEWGSAHGVKDVSELTGAMHRAMAGKN